ncbi:acid-sensing ion channel 1-like [Amphiura filiformis]|uniref:acid-sensing ion channel 1-like n=1 Tax=Amphiura filiformis TaxID=82378 RepID=UPI003B20C881
MNMEPTADDNTGKANAVVMEEKTFKMRLQEYGNTTTLHGARYIWNPKYHGMKRLIWVLLVVGLNAYLWYSIVRDLNRYFKYPVQSYVTESYTGNLTFPAVTLCNYNLFRKSAVSEDLIQFFDELFNPYSNHDADDAKWKYMDKTINESWHDFDNFVLSGAHQINDMLHSCSWSMLEPCGIENFTQVITDWGVCYTFNNPDNISDALVISKAGIRSGLFMRLNIQQDEYAYGANLAAGFKILLHPQGVQPLVRDYGFSVSPGFETSIAVKFMQNKNLAHPYPSNCKSIKDGTMYSQVYTVSNCLHECKINHVVQKCKCRDFRYPGNEAYCSPQKLRECIFDAEEEFEAYAKQSQDLACNCSVPCVANFYEQKISIAFLPGGHRVEALMKEFNSSKEDIRENYLDLNIYFESLRYPIVEEIEAYSTGAMLSDIGGSMGLLAGMSLVTMVEFIDFMISTCYKKYTSRSHARV